MNCTDCRLHTTCRNVLQMGKGLKTARIMIVQESPTELENSRKEYMLGRAGKMLKTALQEVGIDLEDCYFTSIVKCSTPEDRPPLPDEVKACKDYLMAEIDIIKPEIIIPTGNMSMKALMGVTGITKQRGKVTEKGGIKYFPIVHPNMVLKNPTHMDAFSEDIITLSSVLNGTEIEGRANYKQDRVYGDTYEDAIAEIKRLLALPSGTAIAIDLESTKANPYKSYVTMSANAKRLHPESERVKISAIGFSDSSGYGSAIPLYHRENTMSGNQIGTVVKFLRFLLEREDIEWVTQNGKFEIKWLRKQLDIQVSNVMWDTMLMHYLAITEEKGTHDLGTFSWLYTDMGGYDSALNDVAPKGKDKGNYDLIPWDILKKYLADDCDVTYRVYEKWRPLIEDDEEFYWLWNNIMIPATYTFANIEGNGAKIDRKWLEHLQDSYPKEIQRIEDKLRNYSEVVEMEREWQELWEERCYIGSIKKADRTPEQDEKFIKNKKYDPNGKKDGVLVDGTKFNFGSNAQLGELFFNRLGLKTVVLTDKGNPSTNDDSLKYMLNQHEICKTIMEYRKVNHLYNNFVSGMEEHMSDTDFVHGNYNLHGTVTGRLSSNEPNMQQMPRKSNDPLSFQYWNDIKKLFVSRYGDDGVMVQFDYSQLELRILAVFSQDSNLIDLYRSGADLHKAVASDAFGVPIDEITKDQRTASKKIQFGVVYQESAKGLSEDLRAEGIDMSVQECERFIEAYFNKYPKVDKWIKGIKKHAKRYKQVKTLTNRIRRLPTIDSIDQRVASEAERQCVNSPIQSTGSDCTLMSLILIDNWLQETNKKSKLAITVHDSLVIDCHKSEVVEVSKKVKHIMENLAEYNEFFSFLGDVPIVSDMEIGYSYAESFECSIEEIEEHGVDGYLEQQIAKSKKKEQEVFKEVEDNGGSIPPYVTEYWNSK